MFIINSVLKIKIDKLQGAIMKKLLFFTMMLVLIGSMVALESDASEVVGYVKYSCVIGSNLIALPMDAEYTTSATVGDDITDADQMTYWNATSQGWISSGKNFLGNWLSPFAVDDGMALMVRVTSDSDFFVTGSMFETEPTYDILVGSNTIMVPLSETGLTTSALVGNDMVNVDQMTYWNADSQGWVSSGKNFLGNWLSPFSTDIAMPMMTRATEAFTWPSPPADFIKSNFKKNKIQK
jgi:hypothetical protein